MRKKITIRSVGLTAVVLLWVLTALNLAHGQTAPLNFEAYLRKSAVNRQTLDLFLDPKQLSWAKFDPITGYRLDLKLASDTRKKYFADSGHNETPFPSLRMSPSIVRQVGCKKIAIRLHNRQ